MFMSSEAYEAALKGIADSVGVHTRIAADYLVESAKEPDGFDREFSRKMRRVHISRARQNLEDGAHLLAQLGVHFKDAETMILEKAQFWGRSDRRTK